MENIFTGNITRDKEFMDYREKAKGWLKKSTPKEQIKQRDGGGGVKLDYVEGAYVIRVLNTAFDNMWDWDIIDFKIVESQPKVITKYWDKGARRYVELKEPKVEPQPPIAHVLGRLSVPGFGSRIGFGSKVVLGGASEQDSIFKSANTDALKVAAKLFGIALDLYEETPFDDEDEIDIKSTRGNTESFIHEEDNTEDEEESDSNEEWDPSDIMKLQACMKSLGLEEKSGLNAYVKGFSEGSLSTWEDVTPQNIKIFLVYLEREIGK